MTKKEKTKIEGGPKYAWGLSKTLFEAFVEFERKNGSKNDRYLSFDIMMGMAQFTKLVLSAMTACSGEDFDYSAYYMNTILPAMNYDAEELNTLLKNAIDSSLSIDIPLS